MTRLSIPDMSCGHCRATVTSTLAAVPGVTRVTVDPEGRTAEVQGDAPLPGLLSALEQAGYPAVPA